jgi:hypothetical protein
MMTSTYRSKETSDQSYPLRMVEEVFEVSIALLSCVFQHVMTSTALSEGGLSSIMSKKPAQELQK